MVVTGLSPSRYEVAYAAVSRGQYQLHIQVKKQEINGSPFTITVYPQPTHLGRPVRVVTGLNRPYGIACNSRGEMVVSETQEHRVSVVGVGGKIVRTFGSHGDSPDQMEYPRGIAVDEKDNIYVSSEHKLQKFTSSGELIKCVGGRGGKVGEFDDPRGVTIHDNHVYVCDRSNHRILALDFDLNVLQVFGSRGKGNGEFNAPLDVKFDASGNMYVAELMNERVQVLDSSGHFIRELGCEKDVARLRGPSGLLIADEFVYVSDYSNDCILVYNTSGVFVTSIGRSGHGEGEFSQPYCITSSPDGFVYVCDCRNDRIHVF